jgi:hypothetical protein
VEAFHEHRPWAHPERALLEIIEGSDDLLETFELVGRAYRIEPNHGGASSSAMRR